MAAQAYAQRQYDRHGGDHRFSHVAVGLLAELAPEHAAMTVHPTEALNLLQELSLDSPKSADAVNVLRQLHIKGFRLAVDRQDNGEVTLDEEGLLRLVTAIIHEVQYSHADVPKAEAFAGCRSVSASSSLSPVPSIPGYNITRSHEWYQEMQQAMHVMLAEVDQVRTDRNLTPQARFNAENALWADFQTKYPSELKCGVDIFSDQFATL